MLASGSIPSALKPAACAWSSRNPGPLPTSSNRRCSGVSPASVPSKRALLRHFGTLKAIGFQRGTITALFLGEALTVACIGAGIGIGAAALVFRSVDLSLYIPNFISFVPTKETLAAAFVLSILVGLIRVVYSAYRVSGLTIAEALRSTE